MATEVLRPQDRLAADRFHATPSFHRSRNLHQLSNLIVNKRPYTNYSHNNGPKKTSFSPKPDNKRTDGTGSRKTTTSPSSSPPPSSHVTGHVTLLRRGDSLDSWTKGGLNKNDNNNRSVKSPDHKPYYDDDCNKKLKDHHQKSRSRGYKSCDDVAICGTTSRIGPESPEMFPKQIKLLPSSSRDVYAGSAFSLSPSPRSLPLPSFFGNNNNKVGNCNDGHDGDSKAKMVEESATNGLRRLLRLD